jgi:hypothetical protein
MINFNQTEQNNSLYSISYVAYDPEVTVTTKEITNGYKLTLKYSLYFKKQSPLKIASDTERISQIEQMFGCLNKLKEFQIETSILLEHQYDTDSLLSNGVNALRGNDFARVNQIKIANNHLNLEDQFIFVVANIERKIAYDNTDFHENKYGSQSSFDDSENEETISSDHDFDNDIPDGDGELWDEMEVNVWIDLNNRNKIVMKKSLSENEILKNLIDPNSERIDDAFEKLKDLNFWGNKRTFAFSKHEGCKSANFGYRKNALVLVPKSKYFQSLLLRDSDAAICYAHKSFIDTSVVDFKHLEELLKLKNLKNLASIQKIAELLESSKSLLLTKRFIGSIDALIKNLIDNEKIYPVLTRLTLFFGWQDIFPCLRTFMLPVTEKNLTKSLNFLEVSF